MTDGCFEFTMCMYVFQMLRDIVKLGPEVLLNINESYSMFVGSGLIPVSPLHTLVKLASVLHVVTVCRQVNCLQLPVNVGLKIHRGHCSSVSVQCCQ